MARLQQFYREKVVADLMAKFGYKSTMEVPRLTKITLNMGVSEAVAWPRYHTTASNSLNGKSAPQVGMHIPSRLT